MITVVVCDDHPVVREGVVRVLSSGADITVVGQADSGREGLELIRGERPQVAFVDFRLPDMTGADIAEEVHRLRLPTRVVLLSAYAEASFVTEAMRRGASAYLSKEAGRSEILSTTRAVAAGRILTPLTSSGDLQARRDHHPALSPRELQVLEAIAGGRTVPQIASLLRVAPSTVKTTTQRLYAKLGVADRGSAVAEGMRRRLLH